MSGDSMKKLIFASVLLFLTSLGVGLYAQMAARRDFAQDVIYVTPLVTDSRFFFDASAVRLLEIYFPHYEIATSGRGIAVIASSAQEVSATIIYTNAFNMRAVDFTEGGYARAENTAALSKELAWRLFGTTQNITGLSVQIGDEEFMISGVVCQAGAGYTAWLPINASTPISSLYLRPTTPDPLAVYQTREMLNILHRNPDDYVIKNTGLRLAQLNRLRNIALITGIISYAGILFYFLRILLTSSKRFPTNYP